MKQFYTLVLLLAVNSMCSQVQTTSGIWTAIGDVALSTVYNNALKRGVSTILTTFMSSNTFFYYSLGHYNKLFKPLQV